MTALRLELAAAEKHAEDLRQAANIEEMLLKNDVVKQRVYDAVYASYASELAARTTSSVKAERKCVRVGWQVGILRQLSQTPGITTGSLIKALGGDTKRVLKALGYARLRGLLEKAGPDTFTLTDKGRGQGRWLLANPDALKYMGDSYYTGKREQSEASKTPPAKPPAYREDLCLCGGVGCNKCEPQGRG